MNEKLVSDVMTGMIEYSNGNLHDISHFMKVHSFARTIGILEGISEDDQETVEIASILHDIACPLCRIKYGNTFGAYQEKEGGPLARDFLSSFDISEEKKERIIYLVSHHHTYTNVDWIDYRILLEADFLVNADEGNMTKEMIENGYHTIFRTKTGSELLESIYFDHLND
jgi:uncharacterized protein